MSIGDWLRNRNYPEAPDFSVPVGPHKCPECGTSAGVYVRFEDDLVCTSCRGGNPSVVSSTRPDEFHKDRP